MSATVNPNPNALLKDAATIRDFNNDGNADILWRNETTGQNAIWLMDGTNISQAVALPNAVPTVWD
nr:FG-GAP repeat protein [Scytonema hyalinum WJT4-NPBG1]